MINIFTEPVIHDENLKGYKRNYCKIGVVILAGGVVCAVFFKSLQCKIRECCFYGDNFCRVFIWNGFVNKSEKKIKLYNEMN